MKHVELRGTNIQHILPTYGEIRYFFSVIARNSLFSWKKAKICDPGVRCQMAGTVDLHVIQSGAKWQTLTEVSNNKRSDSSFRPTRRTLDRMTSKFAPYTVKRDEWASPVVFRLSPSQTS